MLYTEPDIGTQAGTDTAYAPSGRSVRCSPSPFKSHSKNSYGSSALRRSFSSCPSSVGQERFFMPFLRIRQSSGDAACRRSSAPPPRRHGRPKAAATQPARPLPCPGGRCATPSGWICPLRSGTMSPGRGPVKGPSLPENRPFRYSRPRRAAPGRRNFLPSSRWTTSARRTCTSLSKTWASGENWPSAQSATPCSSPAQRQKNSVSRG